MSDTMWSIRDFRSDDASGVDALLDAGTDPLFVDQAHVLHGAGRDGERWKRTLVASTDSEVVGAATVARNRVHPGRYSFALEVAAARRRRGIGRSLTEAALAIRPRLLPLAAKIRPTDPAAGGLLHALNGRVYQTCQGLQLDPHTEMISQWCNRQPTPAGTTIGSLEGAEPGELVEAWRQQYLWVHEPWSPADPQAVGEVTPEVLGDLEAALSIGARRSGRLRATAWVFVEADGSASIVAETVNRHEADGTALLAATLARCLQGLQSSGISNVEFDGHVDDPHLVPVCATLTPTAENPLLLVEVT